MPSWLLMSVQHLFDSGGKWIAFRHGQNVFDAHGKWIGWLPWDDEDVVDTRGRYLGSIFPGDRLYRKSFQPYRGYPGYPGYPGILATQAIRDSADTPPYQPAPGIFMLMMINR